MGHRTGVEYHHIFIIYNIFVIYNISLSLSIIIIFIIYNEVLGLIVRKEFCPLLDRIKHACPTATSCS